jgi:hypothetical protein
MNIDVSLLALSRALHSHCHNPVANPEVESRMLFYRSNLILRLEKVCCSVLCVQNGRHRAAQAHTEANS